MSGLKEIRTRINSITSTQKITSALKMVSAAKFHKAQETVNRFKPFSKKIFDVLSQVFPSTPELELAKWFNEPKSLDKVALVILTSNSSMCAGFNQNLIKTIMDEGPVIFKDTWGTDKLSVFCLGKKGHDFFSKRDFNIIANDNQIVTNPYYEGSTNFSSSLIERFLEKEFDAVYVAYNQFKNPALQTPVISRLLPFELPKEVKETKINPNLVFEPTQEYIMGVLIPTALTTFFHEMVLENAIGEHGARMTAMHQATENAIELNKNLKLQYNKARQAAITKEILEIVSGAEALKGKSV